MFSPPNLCQLPTPNSKRIALHVTSQAESAIRQGHPWLFDQAIRQQSHAGAAGDLAVIFDSQRRFLAIGLYDPASSLRVRILQHGQPAAINAAWFQARLAEASQRRTPLLKQPETAITNGYRLVHGENDGLPGLVIDRYAATGVIKLYTPAWIPYLRDVCAGLLQLNLFEHLILRLSRSLLKQPEFLFGLQDGISLSATPPQMPILFQENGLTFEAHPIEGQKTGFFLDQRDNRARVEALSAGKAVLNVFAYTGGFSVYAARGGAKRVVSVDLSAPALQAASRNMAHNAHRPSVAATTHETIAADAFDVLAEMASQRMTFDLVILDPPMFAQNQAQLEGALAAYRRLTRLGLGVLHSGGILVQASCSSRVQPEAFFDLVHQVAQQVGRPLQEIARTGHALDHPITFHEGAYLKCLFAQAA